VALNLENYRFRGATAEGRGRTLLEAASNLSDFWDSRPSLVVHNWGALTIAINIDGREAIFEITDPETIDALEAGDTGPLIDWMAGHMGVDPEDASDILDQSSEVIVAVDRIRPPGSQKWEPESGSSGGEVLPDAALSWVGEISKQADSKSRRRKNRPRKGQAKRLLEATVKSSAERGLTDSQISKKTGVPRSTVRDTRMRLARKKNVQKEFKARAPGKRLTKEQKAIVIETLSTTDNNAAEAARQLGIPARTVRGIRQRAQSSSVASPRTRTSSRTQRSESTKASVLGRVREGMTATEAGRQLGVPGRTARSWVSKAKKEGDL